MKFNPLKIAAILLSMTLGLASCGPKDKYNLPELQVSHEPSPRNVVLEEYTGVNCGFCPDGHERAAMLAAAYPGRVSLISIHQGSYASRYATQWGNALAALSGVTGYPVGTVNRQLFSGQSLAMGRELWSAAAESVMSEPSCANLVARALILQEERKMVVDVKGYYTAASAASTNMLNVAVLQNEIIGPQTNYGNYNRAYITADGQYRHMHMLRDLITGQWGEEIAAAAGTEFSRRYEYAIPEKIANEAMVLDNLQVIVFLAESHQDIITGVEAEIIMR